MMMMTRALRRLVCRLMIGLLVFSQMAIAAYACPSLSSARQALPAMAMDDSVAGMPGEEAHGAMSMSPEASATPTAIRLGCDQIDDNAPNLCVEHCHFGQQSADHPSARPYLQHC